MLAKIAAITLVTAGESKRARQRQGEGHGTVKGCKVTKDWANTHLDWCPWGEWNSWYRSGA